jgi:hypothetical protein
MTIIDVIVQGTVWTFVILAGLFSKPICYAIRVTARHERKKKKAQIRAALAEQRKAEKAELKAQKQYQKQLRKGAC